MQFMPSLWWRVSKVYCDSIADGLIMDAVVTAMLVQTPRQ